MDLLASALLVQQAAFRQNLGVAMAKSAASSEAQVVSTLLEGTVPVAYGSRGQNLDISV